MAVRQTTFTETRVADPARTVAYEIGDAKQAEFYPQFKTMHWGNECNFSLRLVDDAPTAGVFNRDASGKIQWLRNGRTARFYKVDGYEDGGFEVEVELSAKPASNVLAFTIQTKGLKFNRQEALTASEIAEGWNRPDNVVGSYAVYHATKRNNLVGGKHYRTGKAFHIFRPHATDANGVRTWCDLRIDEVAGTLTITVPQKFLDVAAYPVLIDPTFGHATIGGTNSTFGGICRGLVGSEVLAAVTGDTITSFSIYGTAASGTIEIGAYSLSSGAPSALLTGAATGMTLAGSAQWNTSATVSQAMSNGVSYCVCFSGGAGTPTIYFDSPSGTGSRDIGSTLPVTWTEDSQGTFAISMYATYTAGGATGNPWNYYAQLG